MRQRKAKDMEERLQKCIEYIVARPDPDVWEQCFGKPESEEAPDPLYLEIGCGKGQFIIKQALNHPDRRYIAIEGQETVILRALEKTASVAGRQVVNDKTEGLVKNLRIIYLERGIEGIDNLKFVCTFVNEMKELFKENQLDGIYLNFSDPWPKARHARRRLTCHERMLDYAWALKTGGFVEIKTDNDGLFEFTLEELNMVRDTLEIVEMTRDLHAGSYESKNAVTEYEEKFNSSGKNINYVKVIVKK